MSAPLVSGLASLLTTLGYSNNQVYDYIRDGAVDLPCDEGVPCKPGYDPYTGWGRINMGISMAMAERSMPGMVVVPNEGHKPSQDSADKGQRFNLQGSGFTDNMEVQICWTWPNQQRFCVSGTADGLGVVGLGIQPGILDPTGVWTASICEEEGLRRCASGAFTVLGSTP
jgi:hypothetical protein